MFGHTFVTVCAPTFWETSSCARHGLTHPPTRQAHGLALKEDIDGCDTELLTNPAPLR